MVNVRYKSYNRCNLTQMNAIHLLLCILHISVAAVKSFQPTVTFSYVATSAVHRFHSVFQPTIDDVTSSGSRINHRQTLMEAVMGASGSATTEAPAIQIDNLQCTHDGGDNYQLDNVSYNLPRNVKIALVGRNGTGKSTLLRILAEQTCKIDGQQQYYNTIDMGMKYTGSISCPKNIRVAFVEQEPPMCTDVTVADALLGIRSNSNTNIDEMIASSGKSIFAAVRRYKLAAQNVDLNPTEFTSASALMDALDGWSILTKADEVATKLRVHHIQDRLLSKLSGGERKRVALAAALIQEPDVLLLDEPTNYLSLAGVQWLSDLLQSNKKLTILMVTHDRAFLDEVCDRILELDRGQLYEYTGTYADYLQAKEERLALEDAAVQTAKAKYKLELEWMRRQPQARQTKSKARIDAFYKLQKATKPRPREVMLSLSSDDRRVGGKVLSLKNVNLRFGDNVILNDFSYEFCLGDRICISGGNGVGKTSFVRVLTGEVIPESGIVEFGETIKLGVYDQMGIKIENPDQTVLEFVLEQVQANDVQFSIPDASVDARRLLNQFEFPRQRWNQRISVLSGGERRRLQLLTVLTKNPNFLILDECTSDLDHQTVMAVESYLQTFDGVLLIISHDRFFADKITDHLFIFQGNGDVLDFPGTLSEYASTLIEHENDRITGTNPAIDTSIKTKENFKDDKAKRNEQRNKIRQAKKDLDALDKSMEKLKTKAKNKQKEIDESSTTAGWSVLATLTDELNGINETIEQQELQWMELADFLEVSENDN